MNRKCRRNIRVPVGLAFAVLAAACRSDRGPVGEDFSDEAETTQLECQSMNYPCTWAEVDVAVAERTFGIGAEASRLLSEQNSISSVVAMLETHPDVGEVTADERSVRFRLEGGRPITVVDGNAWSQDTRSFPLAPQPGQQRKTDNNPPVGASDPKKKPNSKRYLILAPFEWEFGSEEGSKLQARLLTLRDASKGHVEYRANGFLTDANGKPKRATWTEKGKTMSARLVDYAVSYSDFMGWDKYDLVHVSTHGFQHCPDSWPGRCETQLATGALFLESARDQKLLQQKVPAAWAGKKGRDPYGENIFIGKTPGVSYVIVSDRAECKTGCKGNLSVSCEEFFCGKDPVWEVVTADFFYLNYKTPIRDAIVFLNGCESLSSDDLAKALKRGRNVSVLGWKESPHNTQAVKVADVFYRYLLGLLPGEEKNPESPSVVSGFVPPKGGYTVEEAWQLTNTDPKLKFEHVAQFGLRGRSGGESSDARGVAELRQSGDGRKRGREIVFLLDPESNEELKDGGWLETIGAPGDGKDDSLRVDIEVVGVGEGDDPRDFVLKLRIGTRELDDEWTPEERAGKGVWRREGAVPIGFDTHDGQVEDIEVWTELPGGGISRWLYEDMHLGGPYWRLSFTGGEESGGYSGNAVEFRLAEDRWDGNTLAMRSQKSADPDVTISVQLPPDFSLDTGTYPLCFSEHDYCAEILFNPVTQDPLAQDWAGYVTGDGVTVDYPYDGNDMGPAFRYPPPATLTITRVADDIIEGRIEGQLFKEVYTPKPVGHSRHFVMASATIEFAAKRLRRP